MTCFSRRDLLKRAAIVGAGTAASGSGSFNLSVADSQS
jgi:hypothetical protein